MRELAVRNVDVAPVVEEGNDGGFFPVEQAMYRVPARRTISERVRGPAAMPAPCPLPVDLEHTTDPCQAPARLDSVIDDLEETFFCGRINTRRDRAA